MLFFIDNKYKITTYTGDKPGAGTDAIVYIHLYGNLAEVGPIKLDDEKDNFERGQ